jgi:hypothetical protein
MDERDRLAERFKEHRTHPRAVAYRMLGSPRQQPRMAATHPKNRRPFLCKLLSG